MKVDNIICIKEVAYNARGQRILIAYGNKIMTRYAYDPKTFRVLRQRSALFIHSGHTYTPDAGIRQDLQYTYDLEGTITSMNDAAPANTYAQGPGNLLRLFTHDPLRRLLSATGRETSNVYTQPSWDLNIRTQDYTKTNTYTRRYEYDKIGNIQQLKHEAAGHSNQDFHRDYSYGSTNNRLSAFTVNSTLFANKYDSNGNLTKEGESRYYEWGANDKLVAFKNQAGTSTPSVYTNYFYNAQGERIKKHTRKGNKIVVTFYMDGGMFETSYTKTVGGSIDNNRFYNTIKIQDDGGMIATIRVGNNVDDNTFAIKYIVGDHLNKRVLKYFNKGDETRGTPFNPLSLSIPSTIDELIEVFPIPASDLLQINLPANLSAVALRVTDLHGRLVRQTTGTRLTYLQVNEIKSGVYILHITLDTGQTIVRKILIGR